MKKESPRQKLVSEMSVILRVLEDERTYPRPNLVSIARLQENFGKMALELANMEIKRHRRRLGLVK